MKIGEVRRDVSPFLANLNASNARKGFPIVNPLQLTHLGQVGVEGFTGPAVGEEIFLDIFHWDILAVAWLFSKELHQLELSKPAWSTGKVLQGRHNVPNLGCQSVRALPSENTNRL
ncbi:hypothetical protein [Arthrobacter sp. RAF14]|uniref:hypothetical protein n=1 Tax=Arthrobacter sp. RAF14 TaxID=3233051 RepID=UPI003F931005